MPQEPTVTVLPRGVSGHPGPGEPEPGTVPAPGSLAATPGRNGRLRACIDELTIERDSLTVIIEHLERLVS